MDYSFSFPKKFKPSEEKVIQFQFVAIFLDENELGFLKKIVIMGM
jgi:hypothetical protein